MGKIKNKVNIVLIIVILTFSIILLTMLFLSVGKTYVASYEKYVIGGLYAFLIIENLAVIFIVSLVIVIIASVILLYRVIRK